MTSHLSNPWNNAVAYLEMFEGENLLASGSSFLWTSDGRSFLVTNWHNLTGRNPLTSQLMSITGAVPGLPKMLIDIATREGMSGSVVIARHIVVGRDYPKKDGTRSGPILYGKHDLVLGIYSGRHYPDLDMAQLGIVWKRRAIEETLSAKKRARIA